MRFLSSKVRLAPLRPLVKGGSGSLSSFYLRAFSGSAFPLREPATSRGFCPNAFAETEADANSEKILDGAAAARHKQLTIGCRIWLDVGYLGTRFDGWQTQRIRAQRHHDEQTTGTGTEERQICRAWNRRRGCHLKNCRQLHRCHICGSADHPAYLCTRNLLVAVEENPSRQQNSSGPAGAAEAVQAALDGWVRRAVFAEALAAAADKSHLEAENRSDTSELIRSNALGVSELQGYSRTDVGVHAVSQLCWVDVTRGNPSTTIVAAKLQHRLNRTTPRDVKLNGVWVTTHKKCSPDHHETTVADSQDAFLHRCVFESQDTQRGLTARLWPAPPGEAARVGEKHASANGQKPVLINTFVRRYARAGLEAEDRCAVPMVGAGYVTTRAADKRTRYRNETDSEVTEELEDRVCLLKQYRYFIMLLRCTDRRMQSRGTASWHSGGAQYAAAFATGPQPECDASGDPLAHLLDGIEMCNAAEARRKFSTMGASIFDATREGESHESVALPCDLVWFVSEDPTRQRIRRALESFSLLEDKAARLVGTHDFNRFSAKKVANGFRTIVEIAVSRYHWNQEYDFVELRFTADGFLRHMVRKMVAFLVDYNVGTAPPQGLWLWGRQVRESENS